MVLVMEYPHKENVLKLTVNDYDKIVMEIINSMVLDIGKLILMVTANGIMEKKNDIQKEWLSYEGCKEEEKITTFS